MSKINAFCPKCGVRISVDDNREFFFCNKCGNKGIVPRKNKSAAIEKNDTKEYGIPNLCSRCNGILTFSEDRESAVCEYCGAIYSNKKVYINRDETEIQRAEIETKKRKIELEAEERKRKLEIEAEEKRRQENRELEEIRKKRNKVLTEVWSWIFGVAFYILFIIWAVRNHNGLSSWLLMTFAIILAAVYGMIMLTIHIKPSDNQSSVYKNENQTTTDEINSNITGKHNNSGNEYVDLGNNNTANTHSVAKGIATGAAIGTGIAAAGLAFKGIRKILK